MKIFVIACIFPTLDIRFSQHTYDRPKRDRHGRDRMIVGFTTTYAISTYHH